MSSGTSKTVLGKNPAYLAEVDERHSWTVRAAVAMRLQVKARATWDGAWATLSNIASRISSGMFRRTESSSDSCEAPLRICKRLELDSREWGRDSDSYLIRKDESAGELPFEVMTLGLALERLSGHGRGF